MNSVWWRALLIGAVGTLASEAAVGGPAFTSPGSLLAAGPLRLAQFLPQVEYGYSLPSVAMDGHARSQSCQTNLPVFGHPDQQYWAPQGKIGMSNDGGWCWIQFGQVVHSLKFVPKTAVVTQPTNGQVQIEMMTDRVSVAYRPSPGFTGSDVFEVRTEGPFPHTVPIAVTVR